ALCIPGKRIEVLAEQSLLEDVIAEKGLVGALAGQYQLVARLPDMPREDVHWGWSAAEQRRLGMPNDVSHDVCNVASTDAHAAMTGAQVLRHEFLMAGFVIGRVIESDRECLQIATGDPLHERRDDRRIEPAAEIGANGHVTS